MTEGTPAEENSAEVSVTFDLLANARRRGVLYAVKRDGAATVEELAERIAAWQAGAGAQQGEGDASPSPADVRTSLLHVHLPKLADAKVVDYDAHDGTVELAEAHDLDPYLRAAGESESPPSHLTRRTEPAD
ncbi:DUF7344 domain-containing protein [Halorussus litoreus]|uniref:DUF7344 domain-containing protein n=1 Tax=Halorussus litoreus TaxID=1710536 RepID=UPI001E6248E9|nr:hypothetical protein [Halorussus litoreus]